MGIKIFSDGADPKEIINSANKEDIDGFTTNPSLMRASGVSDYKGFCLELLRTVNTKPISFEVFADELSEMKRQGLEIATWGENVYVKVPITNTEGQSTIPIIEELSHSGVKLNVTAVFTTDQVLEAANALKGGVASIISVFAGRIADAGKDPEPVMRSSVDICQAIDKNIEVLWASTREAFNIVQAERTGCHIITVPPSLLAKRKLFGKDLKQYSLETVRMFKSDAETAGYNL